MSIWLDSHAPPNVWLGTTVEGQQQANESIPLLLEIPTTLRFLSCEPLLEELSLAPWLDVNTSIRSYNGHCKTPAQAHTFHKIDWIICGGESGNEARRFDLQWARCLRRQCQAAGVSFFFKQTGAHAIDSSQLHPVQRSLHDPKGGNITALPEELQVREIPMPLRPAPAEHSKNRKCLPRPLKEVL